MLLSLPGTRAAGLHRLLANHLVATSERVGTDVDHQRIGDHLEHVWAGTREPADALAAGDHLAAGVWVLWNWADPDAAIDLLARATRLWTLADPRVTWCGALDEHLERARLLCEGDALIRAVLEAGAVVSGLVEPMAAGTPELRLNASTAQKTRRS